MRPAIKTTALSQELLKMSLEFLLLTIKTDSTDHNTTFLYDDETIKKIYWSFSALTPYHDKKLVCHYIYCCGQACFSISLGAQVFLRNYFLSHALTRAENNTASTAQAFEDALSSITTRFVDICGTTEFSNKFSRIRRCKNDDYIKLNSDLQVHFTICVYLAHLFALL